MLFRVAQLARLFSRARAAKRKLHGTLKMNRDCATLPIVAPLKLPLPNTFSGVIVGQFIGKCSSITLGGRGGCCGGGVHSIRRKENSPEVDVYGTRLRTNFMCVCVAPEWHVNRCD